MDLVRFGVDLKCIFFILDIVIDLEQK